MKREMACAVALGCLSGACSEAGPGRTPFPGLDPSGSGGTDAEDAEDDATTGGTTWGPVDDTGSTAESTDGVPDCAETCDGACVDGACCAEDRICGDTCCGGGEVCSFGQCEVPGADCLDAFDCAADEYCEYSLGDEVLPIPPGCNGDDDLQLGKCLPKPSECLPGQRPDPDDEITCLPMCEVQPTGSFDPLVVAHWDGGDVMMAPIVIQLDDDNCNGSIDRGDIPEIVFTSFAGPHFEAGTIHAVSLVDGQLVEKWASDPFEDGFRGSASLAAGNIDGLPGNEIVGCTVGNALRALRADGKHLWTSDLSASCRTPSIADFDQDGVPEILTPSGVYDGATGFLQQSIGGAHDATAADVDGDGVLEIVTNVGVLEYDGDALSLSPPGQWVAVADFSGDGQPELVSIDRPTTQATVWRLDPASPSGFEVVRSGIDLLAGFDPCPIAAGGGPPTIADFDGDGRPDLGVAVGPAYAVFDGEALANPLIVDPVLWTHPTTDCSSRNTGSSVFDFDGDGRAEVLYGDEQYLWVLDGVDGGVLLQTCSTSGTVIEYPVVADVDADGHADIVAVSNDYSLLTCAEDGSKQQGVRVFSDANADWVRTRRVWNQHHYHVTNIDEDGTIPAVETANWTVSGLNNFRQNAAPEEQFFAPDLVGSVLTHCEDGAFGVIARIRNLGQAAVQAGVEVAFFAGDPWGDGIALGTATTTKVLYTAEAEDLLLIVDDPPEGLESGEVPASILIDPEQTLAAVECEPTNNHAYGYSSCVPEG